MHVCCTLVLELHTALDSVESSSWLLQGNPEASAVGAIPDSRQSQSLQTLASRRFERVYTSFHRLL